jgi:hypothetical protein
MTERTAEITDLGSGFAQLSLTGLEILDQKPTVFQFLEARDAIIDRGQEADWAIADLFIFGERLFGEDVWQFINDQRMVRKTVQNKVWIARRFPKNRRHASLTISHHGAVAVLVNNPDHPEWEALAYENLERAEREELSVEDLEEEVRTLQGREAPKPVPPTILELITSAYDKATQALQEAGTEDMIDVRKLLQAAVDSLSDALRVLE